MSSASIMLNLKPNFLKIYSTTPYDFMLEILFITSLFFWYVKILLKSFSFWDIENVKPKLQPRYAYKLYAYKKVYEMWKKVIGYCFCFRSEFLWLFLKFICSRFGEEHVTGLGLGLNLSTLGPAKIDDIFFAKSTLGESYFIKMRAYIVHQSIEH